MCGTVERCLASNLHRAVQFPCLPVCAAKSAAKPPVPTPLPPQGLAGGGPPEAKEFIQSRQEGPQGTPSAETQAKYGDVDKVGRAL